jgi:hypothetical protein
MEKINEPLEKGWLNTVFNDVQFELTGVLKGKERTKELERLECEIYEKCYHGHLPDSHWKSLAKFCLEYTEERMKRCE